MNQNNIKPQDMLTDAAKEDFELWVLKEYGEFEVIIHGDYRLEHDVTYTLDEITLPDTLKNAFIIDWLDSVGIYINVSPNYIDHDRKYSEGDFKAVINFQDGSETISVDLPLEYDSNRCDLQ